MSAYIVDKNHITYLLAAAMARRIGNGAFHWYHDGKWLELTPGDYDRAAEVGNMLWRENVKSVSHRYPNESSGTLPGTKEPSYVVTPHDVNRLFESFDPVQVIKACHCYAYQTCEHDEWEASEAHAFIKALESAAVHVLPGYDKAEWGAPEPMGRNVVSLSNLAKRR